MKKSQEGFNIVAMLLLLVLLSIIGFTGYYVYGQQSTKTNKNEVASAVAMKPSNNNAAATPPIAKVSNSLAIPELGLKLDLSKAPYKDIKYVMIENGQTAAIYSQQVFDKQVEFAKKSGSTVSDSDITMRYSCNRAVYAFYQKYTGYGEDGYEAINPKDRSKDSKLYIGSTGACDPGVYEYTAFKDWVKSNLKEQ